MADTITYKFIRDGKEEIVLPERWQWEVIHNDNSTLKQFADDGVFHQIREIKMDQPFLFTLFHRDDPSRKVKMMIDPTLQKFFHFYRNSILNAGTPEEKRIKLYVFGYEVDQYKNYFVVMPNDDIVVVNNLSLISVT